MILMNLEPMFSLAVFVTVGEEMTPGASLEMFPSFWIFEAIFPTFPLTVVALVGWPEALLGDGKRHCDFII